MVLPCFNPFIIHPIPKFAKKTLDTSRFAFISLSTSRLSRGSVEKSSTLGRRNWNAFDILELPNIFVYLFIFIYIDILTFFNIYIYIFIYLFIFIHLFAYIYIYTCIHPYWYKYLWTYTCIHVYIYIYIMEPIFVYIRIYIHIYIYIHNDTYIHVHIYIRNYVHLKKKLQWYPQQPQRFVCANLSEACCEAKRWKHLSWVSVN